MLKEKEKKKKEASFLFCIIFGTNNLGLINTPNSRYIYHIWHQQLGANKHTNSRYISYLATNLRARKRKINQNWKELELSFLAGDQTKKQKKTKNMDMDRIMKLLNQISEEIRQQMEKEKKQIKEESNQITRRRMETVSYTHLDVYKRQQPNRE